MGTQDQFLKRVHFDKKTPQIQGPLGFYPFTDYLVALKILKSDKCLGALISSQPELLKELHHPHITQLLMAMETRTEPYLVMEYAVQGALLK